MPQPPQKKKYAFILTHNVTVYVNSSLPVLKSCTVKQVTISHQISSIGITIPYSGANPVR